MNRNQTSEAPMTPIASSPLPSRRMHSYARPTVDGSTHRAPAAAIGHVMAAGSQRAQDPVLVRHIATLKRLCAAREWDLVDVVWAVEAPRGRFFSRPTVRHIVDELENGRASHLVVTDLGGLCRSVCDIKDLLDAITRTGSTLVALRPAIDTGTPAGLLAARVLCAVGEWERTETSRRSRAALAAARERGTLQPSIDEELRRRIARMRGAGMTLQAIVDELNAAGVPTVRGGAKWRPSSVQAAVGYKRPART